MTMPLQNRLRRMGVDVVACAEELNAVCHEPGLDLREIVAKAEGLAAMAEAMSHVAREGIVNVKG